MHVLHLEHRTLIMRVLARKHNRRRHAQTLSTNKNVRETRVLHLRQTCLLAIVERDVAHVGLDLRERERDLVVLLIYTQIPSSAFHPQRATRKKRHTGNSIVRAELHIILRLNRHDVREEVTALERKVLNDKVKRVVRVLDAWDGDVPDLLNELGHDDSANVVPQLGLELEGTFGVEEEVLGETGPVVAEALVELQRPCKYR